MSTLSTPNPFDPREFLRLAEELAKRGHDEAALRSAISRAYYAAYWVARRFLFGAGIRVQGHIEIWNAFRQLDEAAWKTGENGSLLRRSRNSADYDERASNLEYRARNALVMAKGILSDLI
jgi:uncharacterized protein (UPF0332 family)